MHANYAGDNGVVTLVHLVAIQSSIVRIQVVVNFLPDRISIQGLSLVSVFNLAFVNQSYECFVLMLMGSLRNCPWSNMAILAFNFSLSSLLCFRWFLIQLKKNSRYFRCVDLLYTRYNLNDLRSLATQSSLPIKPLNHFLLCVQPFQICFLVRRLFQAFQ